jgi:hypothetical protein
MYLDNGIDVDRIRVLLQLRERSPRPERVHPRHFAVCRTSVICVRVLRGYRDAFLGHQLQKVS